MEGRKKWRINRHINRPCSLGHCLKQGKEDANKVLSTIFRKSDQKKPSLLSKEHLYPRSTLTRTYHGWQPNYYGKHWKGERWRKEGNQVKSLRNLKGNNAGEWSCPQIQRSTEACMKWGNALAAGFLFRLPLEGDIILILQSDIWLRNHALWCYPCSEGDTSVMRILVWVPFLISRGKIQFLLIKMACGKWDMRSEPSKTSLLISYFPFLTSHISFPASQIPLV